MHATSLVSGFMTLEQQTIDLVAADIVT